MLVKYCRGVLIALCRPCCQRIGGRSDSMSLDMAGAFEYLGQDELVDEEVPK